MKMTVLKLSMVVLCLSLLVAEVRAVTVGWNFSFQGNEDLASAEVAGAPGFRQANWNNHNSEQITMPLNDLTGDDGGTAVASTVDVVPRAQLAHNSRHHNDHTGPDNRLLDGFLEEHPDVQFADLGTQFTAAGYSVVVYYGTDERAGRSDLSITGSVDDAVARDIIAVTASFAEVGYVKEDGTLSGSTNYTVFSGLDDPGFTVSMRTWGIGGLNLNSISAIQIVSNPIPEPSADLTNDGFVDADDLFVLLSNWDQVGLPGDLFDDPAKPGINADDLFVLLSDWTGPDPNPPMEAAMSATVPEPSSLVLALLPTLGLSFYRRRRRRAF